MSKKTSLQAQRIKQVEELKSSIFERIYEIEQGVRFEIHIAPNVDARIILVLGPNFPIDPPSVTVSPPCAHPWISGSDYRVTGNKKLNDWNQHVNLSKRLKEIVSEFRERPPSLLRVAPPPIPSTPSRPLSVSTSDGRPGVPNPLPPRSAGHAGTPLSGSGTPVARPGPADTAAELVKSLNSKSNEQLEKLLSDESAYKAHFQSCSDAKIVRASLRESNERLARQNLDLEEQIGLLHTNLVQEQAQERRLKETFDRHGRDLAAAQARYSREAVTALLQAEVARAERASDDLVSQAKGAQQMDPDAFLAVFLQQRKAYHLRKGLLDRVKSNPAVLENIVG